jgi:NADH-quinone oxidoreductase subunit N
MLPPISLEVLVLCLGLLLLLLESFSKNPDKRALAKVALFGLFWVWVWSFFVQPEPASIPAGSYWNFYLADPAALFFKRLALLTTLGVLVMALNYESVLAKFLPASRPGAGLGEFYALPLFTCAGLMFMASAKDFILAFAALELVTISFYVLVAYMRGNPASLEAGVKYLILGALSTGFVVYGITWIFGLTGETAFAKVAAKLALLQDSDPAILFAFLLLFVGLGFKVAAVPFHGWVPDVYQGAPTPVTAFLSVGSKSAGFILLLRALEPFLAVPALQPRILSTLTLVAGATLLVGNLAALTQKNLKRLLAYSSIGHAGYLLMAVASIAAAPTPNPFGTIGATVGFYLFGYLLMTLTSFLVLTLVSLHSKGEDLQHFNGLAKRSPFLAFSLLVAMASLAGIPFTVGFYGKFLVFAQAVHAGQYLLLGLGIVTVGAGFYFYFRVIAAMWWNEAPTADPIPVPALSRLVLTLLVSGIFLYGVFPKPILSSLETRPAPSKPALSH